MKTKTRLQRIAQHLKRKGSITKLEASKLYNEFNLGESIRRLKSRHGMNVETVMVPRVGKQAYASYTLKEK